MSYHHPCPGGCGRQVPNRLFACKDCWWRLPRELRLEISRTHRRDPIGHAEAMADASAWFAEQHWEAQT